MYNMAHNMCVLSLQSPGVHRHVGFTSVKLALRDGDQRTVINAQGSGQPKRPCIQQGAMNQSLLNGRPG